MKVFTIILCIFVLSVSFVKLLGHQMQFIKTDRPSGSLFYFMDLFISSKRGVFVVQIDADDYDKIKNKKLGITFSRNTNYCHITNYDPLTQKSKKVFIHNIIMNAKPVDHINHDGLNNKKENLRAVSQSQNAKNQRVKITNKYGLKGVSFNKKLKRYDVYITVDYKHKRIGTYSSLIDAAIAYNNAAVKYHGEYACLNNISNADIEKLRSYDIPFRHFPMNKKNTTGYKGVYRSGRKYFARITHNGYKIHLGTFDTKEDAALAYNNAAIKYNGNNAIINEIK